LTVAAQAARRRRAIRRPHSSIIGQTRSVFTECRMRVIGPCYQLKTDRILQLSGNTERIQRM
jgi:hypothetical protein